MQSINLDNVSLICQFNIDNDSTSIMNLIDATEDIFHKFGCLIKKFYYSKNRKVFSPKYNKFKLTSTDFNEISGFSFQSDFNSKDFEPTTKLDVEINTRYIVSKNVVKLSVVINDNVLLDDICNTYKKIIAVLSENNNLVLSGYSFLLPNYYGAVSFSTGILRKMNMSCSLKNLAAWYSSSNITNGTIGLLNCFSSLTEKQNHYLTAVFGEENVFKINGITAFYNPFAENVCISDYLISDNYKFICNVIEENFSFKQLKFFKER